MKRIYKLTSIVLSMILLLYGCGKVTPKTALDKINSYLATNDYSSCKDYVSSLDSDVITNISDNALTAISKEFAEIYETKKQNDIFDLTLIDASFIEKCEKLWSIASVFKPNSETDFDENLIYLRYFSELSDSLRYKEIFKILKDMHNCGYLETIAKALNDYDVLGESEAFETAQKIAAEFKYSQYDPQEYLISELRQSCEIINKYFVSVNNGFATNDTVVVATAVNNILDVCSVFLSASDTAKNVYENMNATINSLRVNGAFSNYSGKIEVSEKREYEPGQDFGLSVIFGPSSFTNYTSDQSNNKTDTIKISKEEAIRITVSAINKTKGYRGELQVDRTQNINVQMTSFNTVSEVTNTITLVRAKINDELNKSNGTSKGTKTFAGGVSGDLTLNDTIPPSGRTASLQPSLVETYSAVKGSGGYVITFTLYPCTSTNDEMSYSLLSIVDGFYFDEDGANAQHKSYYGPTQISIVVNNSGLLSKYSYTITGVADCKFFENNEHVATGEFGFNNRYSYDFKY